MKKNWDFLLLFNYEFSINCNISIIFLILLMNTNYIWFYSIHYLQKYFYNSTLTEYNVFNILLIILILLSLLENSIRDFIIFEVLSQYTFLFNQIQENSGPEGTAYFELFYRNTATAKIWIPYFVLICNVLIIATFRLLFFFSSFYLLFFLFFALK